MRFLSYKLHEKHYSKVCSLKFFQTRIESIKEEISETTREAETSRYVSSVLQFFFELWQIFLSTVTDSSLSNDISAALCVNQFHLRHVH